jgi:hypothetical protein
MACEHSGRVLVVVDTDFEVPGELSLVRAVVVGSDRLMQVRDFDVTHREVPPHMVADAVPLSFLIAAREAGAGDFEVTVTGFASVSLDRPLVERRAITGFREGHTLVLPLPLLRSCANVRCMPELTCRNGACVDPHVPVSELPSTEGPGEELTIDAGAFDAGVRDAAVPDAVVPDGGSACAFGPPTPVLDDVEYSDWDPSVTEDELLLVYHAPGDGIRYATRDRRGDAFVLRGLISLPGFVDPGAPAIAPDGLSIIVAARLEAGGLYGLYELTRRSRDDAFESPLDLLESSVHVAGPGPGAAGLRMLAVAQMGEGAGVIEVRRAAPGAMFGGARVVDELGVQVPDWPALSSDGLMIAFGSRYRPDGVMLGSADIYIARRASLDAEFSAPEPVAAINTPDLDEINPWLSVDGQRLYYSLEAEGSVDWAIFMTERTCP